MNNTKLLLLTILSLLATATFALGQSAGSLDQIFVGGGRIIGEPNSAGNGIAIQPDGKIVVAGVVNSKFAVFRFNQTGTPDGFFGTSGRTIIDIYPGLPSSASAVAIQPDGKIVAVGSTNIPNGSLVNQSDFAIVRFNADGTLDTSFGNGNGKLAPDVASIDNAKDLILQPDGKIVLTGDALYRQGSQTYLGANIFAMRFYPNGSLDTAFGNNGTAAAVFTIRTAPISDNHNSESLALQPDGKIVVVGTAQVFDENLSGVGGAAVARFLPNGQLDNSFDADGKAFTVISNPQNINYFEIKSVALQPDGKIVVAGAVGNPFTANPAVPYDFLVLRYTATGALDTTFDGDGKLVVSIESGNDYARDVLIQSNGKIVIAGESATGANRNFALARLNADGSLDNSFDGDGRAISDFSNGAPDAIQRAALQPDGKILAVGFSTDTNLNTNRVTLARYIGDATSARRPPFDFDGDGKADVSIFRPSNGFWYRLNSQNNSFAAVQFGQSTDKLAPADYDGDGKTDMAVFREGAFGYFYILNSADNTFRFAQFGTTGDAPVPGDWDGDGKADLAVYRAGIVANRPGFFYYRPSAQPAVDYNTIEFGAPNNKPVLGDFDGDGKIDAAVVQPVDQLAWDWRILRSSDNQVTSAFFGLPTDIPVPADYDGDGRTNIAVFRPSNGTWYTSQNFATNYGAVVFGTNGDLPVPTDYDGDGRADVAVFRPSNGAWYLNRTTSGFTGVAFGTNGDKPIPNAFVP